MHEAKPMPNGLRYESGPKSKHSPEELLTCSRKMEEFKKNTTGGSGIE